MGGGAEQRAHAELTQDKGTNQEKIMTSKSFLRIQRIYVNR